MVAGDRLDVQLHKHAVDVGIDPALAQDERRLTYAELSKEIDRYARAMIAAGVGAGDRVAVLSYSSIEALLAFLAAASVGAAYVGLSPKYRTRELVHILNDSRPTLVFSMGSREDHHRLLGALDRRVSVISHRERAGALRLDGFLEAGDAVLPDLLDTARQSVDPFDPAVVLYTSGSTGAPKGAMISHDGLLRGVEIMRQLVPERPRCLTDYPINHISWVLETCLLTLTLGGTLFMRERFDPDETLKLIEEEKLNVWQAAPSMYFICLEAETYPQRDLTSVESVMYFGGPLPKDVLSELGARTGARLVTGWGMTETTGGCTLTGPDADLETLATTVGKPDPRVEVRIVSDSGEEAGPEEPGEILVRAPTLFLGYLNRPEATAEVLDSEGFLHTGDIAKMQADGNIRLVGRSKEMFKSGGYNVYPSEVEMVLGEHPEVSVAAVIPVADELWGEVGVAFVGPRSPAAMPSPSDLADFCKDRLANYKVPKRFVIDPEIPILPSGKVDKKILKDERLREGAGATPVPTSTDGR
jgi:acyl-CoA synthetase (AMP-forming)/AMP-acid ligase II